MFLAHRKTLRHCEVKDVKWNSRKDVNPLQVEKLITGCNDHSSQSLKTLRWKHLEMLSKDYQQRTDEDRKTERQTDEHIDVVNHWKL
jgi:hypothetical protein